MARMCLSVAALLAVVAVSYAVQVPVSMIDNAFQPDTVIVNAGDSVIWTNNGTFIHTSTSGVNGVWDSLWDSGAMAHGVTFVHGFPNDGTFNYYCTFHWLGGMKGVVVVGSGGVDEISATSSALLGIKALPSPFSASTALRLIPAGSGTMRVFSATGTLVRALRLRNQAIVYWDGRDSRGREARPGVYLCAFGSHTVVVTRLP